MGGEVKMTQGMEIASRNSDCVCGDDACIPCVMQRRIDNYLRRRWNGQRAGRRANRKAVKQRSDPTNRPPTTLTFTARQPQGSSYAVTRCTCTDGRICGVFAGSGTVGAADVTSSWSTAARRSIG